MNAYHPNGLHAQQGVRIDYRGFCPECFGARTLEVQIAAGPGQREVPCPYCDGKGHVEGGLSFMDAWLAGAADRDLVNARINRMMDDSPGVRARDERQARQWAEDAAAGALGGEGGA